MTQEQIDEMWRLELIQHKDEVQHRSELARLHRKFPHYGFRCDHKKADGSTSLENGMYCSLCESVVVNYEKE